MKDVSKDVQAYLDNVVEDRREGFRKLFEVDQRNPQFFQSIRGVGYKFVNGK